LPLALGLALAAHIVPANAEGNPAIPRNAGNPPAPAWEKYATPKADRIVVYKALRKMQLLRGNEVLRTYHVALGRKPFGQKMEAGDGRTPEGRYFIDRRNMFSDYHLALHISYPDSNDLRRAAALGVEPGGSIMIHGLPVYLTPAEQRQLNKDWTAGCIALTDPEIDEVWRLVDDGTEVDILP
ncbi:MAG TPA: L,D-transpeptidase family protein, partial [Alphaproteobacteria bacterium]|nr:L,D-transpeptidase family protein [Alphaproteobacteria bacterium]